MYYTWGDAKIPGIVKKLFKVFVQFLNFSPLRSTPRAMDAAIPAPLPMLETLSKIFNRKAVKGRQRFAGDP